MRATAISRPRVNLPSALGPTCIDQHVAKGQQHGLVARFGEVALVAVHSRRPSAGVVRGLRGFEARQPAPLT